MQQPPQAQAESDDAANADASLAVAPAAMPAPPPAGLPYIPMIDGLRAISILFVLIGHFSEHLGLRVPVPGGFGVTAFFFISGFLITSLLLNEYSRTRAIDVRTFYLRRFIRLAPAMLCVVGVAAVFAFLEKPDLEWHAALADIGASLTYTMNYYRIFHTVAISPLGILWSLAIEEHFYLVYPFILPWLLRLKHPIRALAAFLVLALCWRFVLIVYLHSGPDYTYMATDARFDSIMYGAVLALLLAAQPMPRAVRFAFRPASVAIAAAILIWTFAMKDTVARETIRYSLQGLALIPLVGALGFSQDSRFYAPARSALGSRPMVFVGKLSYSLYLWHFVFIEFVLDMLDGKYAAARLPAAIVLTIAASLASYYFVEQSFVRLRRRFGSNAH